MFLGGGEDSFKEIVKRSGGMLPQGNLVFHVL